MKRKFLSLLMAFVMLMSLVPSAFAAQASDFNDVSKADWYYDSVDYVAKQGYFTGTGNNTFSPNTSMTRAMFVQALAAMAGVTDDDSVIWGTKVEESYEPDLDALSAAFSDVDVNASYAKAAAWAVDKGIVNGLGDGAFGPGAIIDRQTMAVMMHRTTDVLGIELNEDWSAMMDYNDLDQVDDWAIEGIAYCSMTGLMHGNDIGDFAPERTLTRAEGAAVLVRLTEHMGK